MDYHVLPLKRATRLTQKTVYCVSSATCESIMPLERENDKNKVKTLVGD
jgi:hypothetical protein